MAEDFDDLEGRHEVVLVNFAEGGLQLISHSRRSEDGGGGGEVGEGEGVEGWVFGAIFAESGDGAGGVVGRDVGAEDVWIEVGTFADEGSAGGKVGEGGGRSLGRTPATESSFSLPKPLCSASTSIYESICHGNPSS